MKIYTIGHSTHTKEAFLNMLKFAEINAVADVRAFPGSFKFPQFSIDQMPEWLEEHDITYKHFRNLGGRRQSSDEIGVILNDAWENQSFHNYADYTLSADFKDGIKDLKTFTKKRSVAYMCSERHPARCHRLIISNFLVAQGWEVIHIIDGNKDKIDLVPHVLGQWGALPIIEDDGEVVYPKI